MEFEEWTKIEVDFGFPKNEANESHILTVLEKIEDEVNVSSNLIWKIKKILIDVDLQNKLKLKLLDFQLLYES